MHKKPAVALVVVCLDLIVQKPAVALVVVCLDLIVQKPAVAPVSGPVALAIDHLRRVCYNCVCAACCILYASANCVSHTNPRS
jgi:hypothetical protein